MPRPAFGSVFSELLATAQPAVTATATRAARAAYRNRGTRATGVYRNCPTPIPKLPYAVSKMPYPKIGRTRGDVSVI